MNIIFIASLLCGLAAGQTTVLLFSLDLAASSLAQLNNLSVALNSTLISQMTLVDNVTNTTVGLFSSNVTASSVDSLDTTTQCAASVSYSETVGGVCHACSVCPKYTVQACTIASDAVCDTLCPVGAMVLAGQCTMCPPGKYSGVRGANWCYTCAAGYYADRTGQSSCKACPPGTTTSTQTGFTACVQVRQNLYRDFNVLICIYTHKKRPIPVTRVRYISFETYI